jgi:putative ABC transport system permease protein
MKSRDLFELAGRNLREAVLRNSLTTLGIAVGVASLVAMLSLGVGLQQMINSKLMRSGLFNAIFVSQRQNTRGFGVAPRKGSPEQEQEGRALDDAALEELKRIPNVTEASPEIRFPSDIHFNGTSHTAFLAGLPPSASSDEAFQGMKGHFFSGPKADEAILQIEFAKDLNTDTASLVGQDLVLRYAERQALPPDQKGKASGSDSSGGYGFAVIPRERKLHIVGIVETAPGGGLSNLGRGGVFIPQAVALELRSVQSNDVRALLRAANGGGSATTSYANVTVRVTSASQVPAAEEAINNLGFRSFSLIDASRNLRKVFAVIDLFLGIFGSLALAVASLGIINTLVMAILERRREIGILKALGAGDRDVRQLFFAEAGAMGLIGGAFGVFLGWVMGQLINIGTNYYIRQQDVHAEAITVCAVPLWLIAGAIGFAIFVSLGAGMYPASRAARLNPVEALRYE